MNRVEFMTELTALLQDISAEEREEALQYYNDYFEDAGIDSEYSVIRELGNPKRVSDMIHAGLAGQNEENSEYRETGYADTRFETYEHPARRTHEKQTTRNAYHYAENYTVESDKKPWTSKWLKVLLIILIICIGAPVVLPLAFGILAAVAGIILGVIGLAVGILIAGVAIVISGIIVLFAAIAKIFVSVPTALAYAGIGFLMLAVGAVITAFTWWSVFKIVPPIFRWLVNFCRRLFTKNRKEAQA